MFFARKRGVRFGKVVRRLCFRSFCFGSAGWAWKKVHFSDFGTGICSRLNPHMVLVGESGGGKSNAVKVMVERLCRSGANVAILDPHDEYLGVADAISADIYDAASSGINIFEPGGMSEKEKASELTGMFRRAFRLGDVQSYTLYRCIMSTYSYVGRQGSIPTVHNLMFTLRSFGKNAGVAEKRILESLERRMAVIDTGSFSRTTDMKKVVNGNSLFLLSRLHTVEAQAVYLEGFLRKVYSHMLTLEKEGRHRLYIVIDEAERIGDNPILGKLAAEGRKYGIGIIATSQRAKALDKDLRSNSSVFISFYQREPEELNYISNFMAGGTELGRFSEVRKGIRGLRIGEAMVTDHYGRAYVVRFDRHRGRDFSIRHSIVRLAERAVERGELAAGMPGACSAEEIECALEGLRGSGQLLEHKIEGGRYAGRWYISSPRNSAEHDIRVNLIGRCLSEMGLQSRVYNSSFGPDIVVQLDGKSIAVEYETGLKSIWDTEGMIAYRRKYYCRTVIVVNDAHYPEYARLFGNDVMAFSDVEKVADALKAS